MARITVEDCVTVVPNRFELCLVASNRAKSILSGSPTDLDRREKPAVIALREIGDNMVDVEVIKQNIIASIKNRGSFVVAKNADNPENSLSEMIIEEVQGQMLKDTTFVAENIQVND